MDWGPKTCRICGEIKEPVHLIHNKDCALNLEEKLQKCLKLQIYKDDFKPKQICDSCLIKLNQFTDFLDLCDRIDQKFDAILLEKHQNEQWTQNEPILDYTQPKMSVIVTPKPTIDQIELDLYKGSVLPLENCINENEILSYGENIEYLQPPYEIKVNFLKKLQGDFYHESTVLRHSSTYARSEPNFCQFQPEASLNYANYTQAADFHLPAKKKPPKNAEKTFNCPNCEKKFKRRVSLNAHTAIHTKLRPYACDTCDKCFAIRCDLTNHQKVHTDRNRCAVCAMAFTAPSKLQRHLRTHTKDKPFACDAKNCTRSFADKRNLATHRLLHTNRFDFACGACGKLFRTRNRLKQHEVCHAAERESFGCDVCGKVYRYKSTLLFHMKKHLGYICSYCEVDCEKPIKLRKHKRVCAKKPIS